VHPSQASLSAKKGHVIVKFFGTNDFAPVKTGPEFLKEKFSFLDFSIFILIKHPNHLSVGFQTLHV